MKMLPAFELGWDISEGCFVLPLPPPGYAVKAEDK